jgi:hypothetical protein
MFAWKKCAGRNHEAAFDCLFALPASAIIAESDEIIPK